MPTCVCIARLGGKHFLEWKKRMPSPIVHVDEKCIKDVEAVNNDEGRYNSKLEQLF